MKSKLLINLIKLFLIFPFALIAESSNYLNFKMVPEGKGYNIIEERGNQSPHIFAHLIKNDTGYILSGDNIMSVSSEIVYYDGSNVIEMRGNGHCCGYITFNNNGSYKLQSYSWRILFDEERYVDQIWNRVAKVKTNFFRNELTVYADQIKIAILKRPFFHFNKEWTIEILNCDYFTDWQGKGREQWPNHSTRKVFCPQNLAILAAIDSQRSNSMKKKKSSDTLNQFATSRIPFLKAQDIKKEIGAFRNESEGCFIESEQLELALYYLEEHLNGTTFQELSDDDLFLTQQDINLIAINECLPLLYDFSYSYEQRYAFSIILEEKLSETK